MLTRVKHNYSVGKGFTLTFPSGGGITFPPYGTILYTEYGTGYALGSFVHSNYLGFDIPSETCDLNWVADGVGGSFADWNNATNVKYYPSGTVIAVSYNPYPANPIEVPTGSGNYYMSGTDDSSSETWDGYGNITIISSGNFTYYSVTTPIYDHNYNHETEVPSGSVTTYWNGIYDIYTYVWDGFGGYVDVLSSVNNGYLFGNGIEVSETLRYESGNSYSEVPTDSMQYYPNGMISTGSYLWDGMGGYYTDDNFFQSGNYFGYGVSITSTSSDAQSQVPNNGNWYNNGLSNNADYFWDGNGGYYANYYQSGSYYSAGVEVDSSLRSNYYNHQTEVPTGSSMMYDNGYQSADTYCWDGSGGYYASSIATNDYYTYGTYITNDGTWTYYWDGMGGYYY